MTKTWLKNKWVLYNELKTQCKCRSNGTVNPYQGKQFTGRLTKTWVMEKSQNLQLHYPEALVGSHYSSVQTSVPVLFLDRQNCWPLDCLSNRHCCYQTPLICHSIPVPSYRFFPLLMASVRLHFGRKICQTGHVVPKHYCCPWICQTDLRIGPKIDAP